MQLTMNQLTSKGVNKTLSKQWATRPPDQRFITLDDVYNATTRFRDTSHETVIDTSAIKVHVDSKIQEELNDEQAGLSMTLPSGSKVVTSNWSFGQLCGLTHTPATYMRQLPAQLAAINIQHSLIKSRTQPVKAYENVTDGTSVLRAVTGPDYGRIYDCDVVNAVRRLVNNSSVEWKVPGALDWGSMTYNPNVPTTIDNTTLYASDRDVFLFLCADRNPIEIGKLPSGDPDLVFRGFYVSNSEVGSRAFSVATMYFRAVCCNRILWGVENFHELTFRHTRRAPERFLNEVAPALTSYAAGGTGNLIEGVKRAKAAIVAETEEEREAFLRTKGFNKADTTAIINSVMDDEQHPAESIWDFVQGITKVAQGKANADARFDMEKQAGKLLAAIK